jgi:hypothetical protein
VTALDLAPWRALGASVARTALRVDPAAAGQLVSLDESDGVLMHLDLYDDADVTARLVAAGIAPTTEHCDAVRGAVAEGYVETMERRA